VLGFEVRDAHSTTPNSTKGLRKTTGRLTAQGQRAASTDSDLAAMVDAWPTLPEAIKAGILALVKASRD
jgi:hypothetical protein